MTTQNTPTPDEQPDGTEPVYDPKIQGWNCPPGYAYPRCPGCGHNFYESRPIPVGEHTSYHCHWCTDEQADK